MLCGCLRKYGIFVTMDRGKVTTMSIGIRIKQARKKRGMSCKELAALVGVTPSAITNYENGISFPKPQVLCALFGALRVDANFLFQDYLP